ncbi:hypothetical protein B566_EDAN009881, partial [Ephemera danica]
MKSLMSELQQTNLEKTLLAWCRQQTKDYPGIDVRNFSTAWSDGLAFNALLHRHRPHLFDFDDVARMHPSARLEHAFRVAQSELGIERLLDPEDVNTSVPDKKSIMMYVMCLFQSLPHTELQAASLEQDLMSPMSPPTPSSHHDTSATFQFTLPVPPQHEGEAGGHSRPLSMATNASVELGGYQAALEESAVGAVLTEGARLLGEGLLQPDEEAEVRVQMRLLNSRWEALRLRAMDIQTKRHETLVKAQQSRLTSLRQWLTEAEDRISRMEPAKGHGRLDPAHLGRLKNALGALQRDLQAQQPVVDSLNDVIVIVGDGSGSDDAAFAHFEDQLCALDERWTHVCTWAEQRGARLAAVAQRWEELGREQEQLRTSFETCETQLKHMEANPSVALGELAQRVTQLQVLRGEMESLRRRLQSLNAELARLSSGDEPWESLDEDSPAVRSAADAAETMQDKMEALTAILDVQTRRESGGAKRRRVSSSSSSGKTVISPEQAAQLQQLEAWLNHADSMLNPAPEGEEGPFDGLSVDEQMVLFEDIESEVEEHRDEADKVRELAEQNEGEAGVRARQLEQRWSRLVETLMPARKQHIDFLQQRRQFSKSLSALSTVLQGYTNWLEHEDSAGPGPRALEQCRAVELSNHPGSEAAERSAVSGESSWFCERWEALGAQLQRRQGELSAAQKRGPSRDFLQGLAELLTWLRDSELALQEETVSLNEEKIKELQRSFEERRGNFENVNAAGHEYVASATDAESLRTQLQELNTRWSDLPVLLEERLARIKACKSREAQYSPSSLKLCYFAAAESWSTLREQLGVLEAWLHDVKAFMQAEQSAAVGEPETLQAQLEQFTALEGDIAVMRPKFAALEASARAVLSSPARDEGEGASELRERLGSLQRTWRVVRGVEELEAWLSQLEAEIPIERAPTASSSAELFRLKGQLQALKDKVDERTDQFREVNELGSELLLIAEEEALVAQERDWLDKLEKRLRKSPKTAADAEEISEELDDLENYIRNHPEARLARIQSLAVELTELDVMPAAVQNEAEGLTARWSQLSQKARDRTRLLEAGISEAQGWEARILLAQQWLTRVHALLTARVDNDLSANDLPDEDKRLVEEFQSQEATLLSMEQQIEAYQEAGQHEAATRLQEQTTLLQRRFSEVRSQFEKFRAAGNNSLEPRLSRALRELRSVEEASCILEPSSAEPDDLEDQLAHCMRFYSTLSDIKGEVEGVIKTGRKMVSESAVSDPPALSARLDTLKELYNKVTESKGALENALTHARELQENIATAKAWAQDVTESIEDRDGPKLTAMRESREQAEEALRSADRSLALLLPLLCDASVSEPAQEKLAEAKRAVASAIDLLPSPRPTPRERTPMREPTPERRVTSRETTPELVSMRASTPERFATPERHVSPESAAAAQVEVTAREIEQWLLEAEQGLAKMDAERGERQHAQHQALKRALEAHKATYEALRSSAAELRTSGAQSLNTLEARLKLVTQRWDTVTQRVQKGPCRKSDTLDTFLDSDEMGFINPAFREHRKSASRKNKQVPAPIQTFNLAEDSELFSQ